MAKIKLLSSRAIGSLPDGLHADGANLFLRVRGDSRAWVFRYKQSGKQIWLGLGSPHARSLVQARDLAALMRNAIANGKDPANELNVQNESKAMTFKDCAQALIELKRPSWRKGSQT